MQAGVTFLSNRQLGTGVGLWNNRHRLWGGPSVGTSTCGYVVHMTPCPCTQHGTTSLSSLTSCRSRHSGHMDLFLQQGPTQEVALCGGLGLYCSPLCSAVKYIYNPNARIATLCSTILIAIHSHFFRNTARAIAVQHLLPRHNKWAL